MAIQTGKFIKRRAQREAGKSIAAQLAKASAGEQKRKGRAGIFGKIGGFLAGEGLQYLAGLALTGLTGGLTAGPMLTALKALQKGGKYAKALKTGLKGAGMFAGKAAAHQATTGRWGEGLKTSGQVEKITSDSKYGYGREEAKSLSEELAKSRESQQDLGTFVGDVAGAYAADFAGKSLGDIFGKGKDISEIGETVGTVEDYIGTLPSEVTDVPYEDLFPASEVTEELSNILPQTIEGSETWGAGTGEPLPWIEEQGGLVPNYKKGGQFPSKAPTISDYFGMQGVTLGGNNKRSLAEMLGRK